MEIDLEISHLVTRSPTRIILMISKDWSKKSTKTTGRILWLMAFLWLSCGRELYDPPKSPEETVASFTISPQFTVDVFAAEPFVVDPVEMIFDDRGRIFIVEMPDYPFKPEPGRGAGKIKQLFDDDQDGRIDRATIFAENISEATSVHPWKDGLLVAAAPNISWLIDTDNDGKADSSVILFTGFFENNSEAQITNLKFMPDNWIYASNHGQGGEVKFLLDTAAKPLSMAGGDFRFRLDQGKFELVSGPAQFGQAFNDRIHRFITQNTLHIRYPIIPWKYLHRNPFIPSKNATVNISDHDLEMFQLTPPPYWRAERTRRRQESYDEQNLGRMEYAEDHFTGASGGTFYGGHTFPREFYGSIFTGDVAGNLIHRDILVPLKDSPSYAASRAQAEKTEEFLASTDSWFRPAIFTVGPDGFLYVVDMYRQHIETPLSIPEDLKEDMDFLEGSQRGRIYRIRPVDQPAMTQFDDLSQRSDTDLMALLSHPNRWHRLQAQRLIVESKDVNLIEPLEELLTSSNHELARLHSLYCLEALNAVDINVIEKASNDASPIVREQSLLLAERLENGLPVVMSLINDPDIRVAFQACLSLGEFQGPNVKESLKKLLIKHYRDVWFQIAVLSSPTGSAMDFMTEIITDNTFLNPVDTMSNKFLQDIAFVIGNRQEPGELQKIQDLLIDENLLDASLNERIFEGFLSGVKRSGSKIGLNQRLTERFKKLQESDPGKWKDLVL